MPTDFQRGSGGGHASLCPPYTLTFHFARDHLKFLLGYDEITPERLATLKIIVRRQTTLLPKSCGKKAGAR